MRKTLPPGVYTQINTVKTPYMMQNLSNFNILIVAGDAQPPADTNPDFVFEEHHGTDSSHIEAIMWGKPSNNKSLVMGIVEG